MLGRLASGRITEHADQANRNLRSPASGLQCPTALRITSISAAIRGGEFHFRGKTRGPSELHRTLEFRG